MSNPIRTYFLQKIADKVYNDELQTYAREVERQATGSSWDEIETAMSRWMPLIVIVFMDDVFCTKVPQWWQTDGAARMEMLCLLANKASNPIEEAIVAEARTILYRLEDTDLRAFLETRREELREKFLAEQNSDPS